MTTRDYRGQNITLPRFAEMARFNYGSTVIVLLPRGVAELAPELVAQAPVRLGQRLALRVGELAFAARKADGRACAAPHRAYASPPPVIPTLGVL